MRRYKLGREVSGERARRLAHTKNIPATHRPRAFRGIDACPRCDGRGWIFILEKKQPGQRHRRVGERRCKKCRGTGDVDVILRKIEDESPGFFQEKKPKWTPGFWSESGSSDSWRFGWTLADELFAANGSFLKKKDEIIEWLYKIRAVIGVVILVTIGLRYDQSTQNIASYFNPVIAADYDPTFLTLLASVLPATLLVTALTKRGKRVAAFRQMVRFPVATALISMAIFGCFAAGAALSTLHITAVTAIVVILAVAFLVSYPAFLFRAVYLLTVDMWRLGDGHPLLPPIIGSGLAWGVAIYGLTHGHATPGEPNQISTVILFGAPASVTIVGIIEIARLRARYPSDFPFRNGPFPDGPPGTRSRRSRQGTS
jgi:hypothetical protein